MKTQTKKDLELDLLLAKMELWQAQTRSHVNSEREAEAKSDLQRIENKIAANMIMKECDS